MSRDFFSIMAQTHTHHHSQVGYTKMEKSWSIYKHNRLERCRKSLQGKKRVENLRLTSIYTTKLVGTRKLLAVVKGIKATIGRAIFKLANSTFLKFDSWI